MVLVYGGREEELSIKGYVDASFDTDCNITGCEARNRENTEVCIAFKHRKSGKFSHF
jgi:hypothetical protein